MKKTVLKKGFIIIFISLMSITFSKCEKAVECDSNNTNKVGAMCNDGTRSNSTGSGTCSSHGGVNYWLCK